MRPLPLGVLLVTLLAPVAAGQQLPQPRQPNPGDADPYTNTSHPLRDKTKDPGEGWGVDDPRVRGTGVRMDSASADWPWGELVYGKTYPAPLAITNKCKSTEQVSIFTNKLPYLNIQRFVSVPGEQTIVVTGTITTPRPPDVLLTGHEKLPHGIFDTIDGSVVVWHAFTPGKPPCMPNRTVYTVAGHVHFDPNPPAGGSGGPEKIAGATPCQVWWNTGEKPRQAADIDCTGEIRGLAGEYRSRVLQPLADRDPAAWAWLPSLERIAGMAIPELLAMKTRAQSLITGGGR